MNSDTVHIGVDVSKEKLDIYVPAKREGSRPVTKEVDNDIKGFRELRDLARKAGATVCVEPTGGYELELIAFMHKFGVPIAYTDALRVRQFARAEGNLSLLQNLNPRNLTPGSAEGEKRRRVPVRVRFLLPSSFPPAPLILLPVFSMC